MPIESYLNPRRGLNDEEKQDLLDDILLNLMSDDPVPGGKGTWERVHTAIRRNGLFVIETSTPSFRATLHFCPEGTSSLGDYEIRHLYPKRVERGHVVATTVAEVKDPALSKLTGFPTRYRIDTVGNDRPHEKKIWFVGLSDFRVVDENGPVEDGGTPNVAE